LLDSMGDGPYLKIAVEVLISLQMSQTLPLGTVRRRPSMSDPCQKYDPPNKVRKDAGTLL
jgi:hypothetical protein